MRQLYDYDVCAVLCVGAERGGGNDVIDHVTGRRDDVSAASSTPADDADGGRARPRPRRLLPVAPLVRLDRLRLRQQPHPRSAARPLLPAAAAAGAGPAGRAADRAAPVGVRAVAGLVGGVPSPGTRGLRGGGASRQHRRRRPQEQRTLLRLRRAYHPPVTRAQPASLPGCTRTARPDICTRWV